MSASRHSLATHHWNDLANRYSPVISWLVAFAIVAAPLFVL